MLIGDFTIKKEFFPDCDKLLEELPNTNQRRLDQINQLLIDLITKEKTPCFLLPKVTSFIEAVNRKKLTINYNFRKFEWYINQFPIEKQLIIRSKIAGKALPREEYQTFFPVGMNKTLKGSHFVSAHRSPDLDTTIASFWGWLDAFASKLCNKLHLWNVPIAPPKQLEIALLFKDIFGDNVFSILSKNKLALSLTAEDVMTKEGMHLHNADESIRSCSHDRGKQAVIVIDDNLKYIADWRSIDVEEIGNLILLIISLVDWFFHMMITALHALFSEDHVTDDSLRSIIKKCYEMELQKAQMVVALPDSKRRYLDDFVKKICKTEAGLKSSFSSFIANVNDFIKIGILCDDKILQLCAIHKLMKEDILTEDRKIIFHFINDITAKWYNKQQEFQQFLEKFRTAIAIKEEVFGNSPQKISPRCDVSEMLSKIAGYHHLTVVDDDGFPLGIVHASDIKGKILGTATLRDFCNSDEIGVPEYVELVSVIDHHSATLRSNNPPVITSSDAQSSNTMLAELSFKINDKYSTRGLDKATIDEAISHEKNPFILTNLWRYKGALANCSNSFFIAKEREILEYLHFLYAILDDTDLLSKVSKRDVDVVVELLNRLKTLVCKMETLVIQTKDLNAKEFSLELLRNEDLYSIYKKVYDFRKTMVDQQIEDCKNGKNLDLYADTKQLYRCCRVGQTKLFFM